MRLLVKFRNSILFMLKILVVAVLTTSFLSVWQTIYKNARFGGLGDYVIVGVYVGVLVLFSKIYDAFKVGIFRTHVLAYSLSLSVFLTNCFAYLMLSFIARSVLNPIALIALTVVQVFVIIILTYSLNLVYYSLYKPRLILAIFDLKNRNDIIKKVSVIKERFELSKGITIDKGLQEIKNEIDKHEAILICDFDATLKSEILKYCYSQNKRIYLLPSSADTILNGSYQVQVFDTPVLFLHNGGLSMEQRIVKRIFDLVLSSIGIIIASPFMLAIAVGIKLCDGGPIIFKQPRITRDMQEFSIYKFRSMKVDSEKEFKRTTSDDDRITAIGKIIRPFRLDELPQLFNIFLGHMSVVGPRPEMKEIIESYKDTLPEFNLRHKVKAGLTGYAQIYGKYNTSAQNKLNMDLYYIEHYSVLEDIKLIAMTIKILFLRESTEGFSEKESHIDRSK